jgi:hypothetical protein
MNSIGQLIDFSMGSGAGSIDSAFPGSIGDAIGAAWHDLWSYHDVFPLCLT